ncbi:hypothetical protein [Rhodococcus sp. IEGM 1379]|uniref:hypothetical protein n=1 Tax=Rhodococcus sp. IEGM 1379 TaxID=3047086 RepID=UPI0024B85F24|nr:hypothetical protein [Rhodococcus sp. IEGM 1379]MDI9914368.1 hypothetical protein [Rhodococcus sp. IEGM 1379]
MEINERFYDDSAFLPIGSPMTPPYTAGSLLSRLKLVRAERDVQLAGVRDWLTTNEPTEGLIRSLNRRGFGEVFQD